MLTDGAVELQEGTEILRKTRADTIGLGDFKHRAAIQQTELAHLIPPAVRPKARFMNLAALLHWAATIGRLLDTPDAQGRASITAERLAEKLGWLPVHLGAGISRIVQQADDRTEIGLFPVHVAVVRSVPHHHRNFQFLFAPLNQHLAGHPMPVEHLEDIPHAGLNFLIRIFHDLSVLLPTILGGLVFCGACGHRLSAVYSGRTNHARYECVAYMRQEFEKSCRGMSAAPIDTLVTQQVLSVLEPARLELSIHAAENVLRERERLEKQQNQQLERSKYNARRAERHYRAVDPETVWCPEHWSRRGRPL